MSATKALLQHLGGMPVDMPMGLVPSRVGKIFFVDAYRGSDSAQGTFNRPLASLGEAHDRMTADNNDIVFVHGGHSATNFAVRLSATLTWSKNSCHIIGLNAYQRFAHRVSIRQASTATVFTPFVNVTASNCVFANFHVFYGFANNSAQVAWDDDGDRNIYYNCHIGGFGHATAAAHAGCRALVLGSGGNGEHYFKNCTFGIDTVTMDAANSNIELVGGLTRTVFEDCYFPAFAGSSGAGREFVTIGSGGIDRFVIFRRCHFINATRSTATAMTQGFSVHASAGGLVLLDDSWVFGCTDVETTASGNLYITNPVVDTADGAIPIVNAPM